MSTLTAPCNVIGAAAGDASDWTVSVAALFWLPAAGDIVISIRQRSLGCNTLGTAQVPPTEKSATLAPVKGSPEIVSGASPMLVTKTTCTWIEDTAFLPNETSVRLKFTIGAAKAAPDVSTKPRTNPIAKRKRIHPHDSIVSPLLRLVFAAPASRQGFPN